MHCALSVSTIASSAATQSHHQRRERVRELRAVEKVHFYFSGIAKAKQKHKAEAAEEIGTDEADKMKSNENNGRRNDGVHFRSSFDDSIIACASSSLASSLTHTCIEATTYSKKSRKLEQQRQRRRQRQRREDRFDFETFRLYDCTSNTMHMHYAM